MVVHILIKIGRSNVDYDRLHKSGFAIVTIDNIHNMGEIIVMLSKPRLKAVYFTIIHKKLNSITLVRKVVTTVYEPMK